MSAFPLLTITREGESFKSQPLDQDLSIGRGEGNLIRLEDRAVSRKHAIIRKTSEGVHIERQSDFAPIRLNGIECTRALIKDGDVVEIGPYRMRLETPPKEKEREPVHEEATLPISLPEIPKEAHLQVPDALPTAAANFGELTAKLQFGDSADLAQPILADSAGAEAGSEDPGSNIFSKTEDGDVAPLEIDFGAVAPESIPDEVALPHDENAPTRMLPSEVKARLEIVAGVANISSLTLDKNEIFIGRGKECDIVLNDKKASRKNTIIVREGKHFWVRDLDSSNGTYLNNSSVKESKLSADDVIRVGDAEIRFIADSADYERRKADFLPVPTAFEPAEELPAQEAPFSASISATPIGIGTSDFGIPTPAPQQMTPPPRSGVFGIIDKYVKNFGTLKPIQKILVVLVAVLFLSWYFEDELGLVEPEPKPQAKVGAKASNGESKAAGQGATPPSTDFDSLPAAKRGEIEDAIRKATDFLRLQDFDKAIYEIQQRVYPTLPNYAQAKEIERYAQEGKRRKEAIEEEAKRKEEEVKRKARILELEGATRLFMSKKKYDLARESFSEILSIDPDNINVNEWKMEIDAWTEEQDRIAKEKAVQEEINKRAWDTYRDALSLHQSGKYREAIEIYQKVPELGSSDGSLLKKAITMIKTCRDSIRDLREPHLKNAREFEKNADLASAFKEYQVATEVDPPHPGGWAGMDRIRDILTERAKVLYTEAVIAESYSDFKTAHDKFNEILKMAPEGSLYHQRAQRKLQSYLNFHAEETQ